MPHADLARDLACSLDPAALALAAGLPPDDWQARVLRSGARQLLLNCSRQVGKSTITSILAARVDDVLLLRYLRDYPGLALPIVLLAPTRPIPLPPNTTFLATPFDIAALSALVADLLAKARDHYWG